MRASTLLPLLLLSACRGEDASDALPVCAVDAPEPGPLHADGTTLRDAHDRVVLLRGVNAGGRSKFAPYAPFDFADGDWDAALDDYLDRLVPWGFSALRVPFSWAAMEPAPGADDEEFLARYDALLDGAADRGLWTIVDFHQDIYAEAFCGDGFPAWTLDDPGEPRHDCPSWFLGYMTDGDVKAAYTRLWSDETGVRTALGEMWDRMAARHADRPGVVGFEIINEPHGGDSSGATWATETLAPFYTELAARVQATAPDALVFFDATGLDAVTASTDLVRPDGDDLVFAPHFYDGTIFSGSGDIKADVEGGLTAWAELGAAWDVPVLIGEMGIQASRDGATEHAAAHYDAMDALGLHGTWWEYSASEELWNDEDLSVTDADGTERAALLDGLVRPFPIAVAGSDARWDFDRETGVFSLSYTAAGGVSEVSIPPRVYPEGVVVTGQGACGEVRDGRLLLSPTGGPVTIAVSPATP